MSEKLCVIVALGLDIWDPHVLVPWQQGDGRALTWHVVAGAGTFGSRTGALTGGSQSLCPKRCVRRL